MLGLACTNLINLIKIVISKSFVVELLLFPGQGGGYFAELLRPVNKSQVRDGDSRSGGSKDCPWTLFIKIAYGGRGHALLTGSLG